MPFISMVAGPDYAGFLEKWCKNKDGNLSGYETLCEELGQHVALIIGYSTKKHSCADVPKFFDENIDKIYNYLTSVYKSKKILLDSINNTGTRAESHIQRLTNELKFLEIILEGVELKRETRGILEG